MRLAIVFACILSFIANKTLAQDVQLNTYGCGTQTNQEQVKQIYAQIGLLTAMKTTATTDTLPISIHIVGKDDGTGYINLDLLLRMLCRLNERYQPAGFYFFINWPLHYINQTSYYTHTVEVGAKMMRENNIPNSINIYFVKDPGGTCGYYHPGANAVAIRNDCAGVNSTTVTHELGHYLGLPHTFNGWEDGVTPAEPEKVTRGSGANCNSAGDGFCDTDADYLSDRWNCPYRDVKQDQDGNLYHPDSSLYMSYANDNCTNRFSDMQVAWMKKTTGDKYTTLQRNTSPYYPQFDLPTILYPNDAIHANLPYAIWNKVPGAEYYYVRVLNKNTASLVKETTTADTMLKLDFNLVTNNTYILRIAAMNSTNFCRSNILTKEYPYTLSETPFTLQSFSSVPQGLRMFPNPASETVRVFLDLMPEGVYIVSLRNAQGLLVRKHTAKHTGINGSIILNVNDLANGLYFLYVTGGEKTLSEKLIISH